MHVHVVLRTIHWLYYVQEFIYTIGFINKMTIVERMWSFNIYKRLLMSTLNLLLKSE